MPVAEMIRAAHHLVIGRKGTGVEVVPGAARKGYAAGSDWGERCRKSTSERGGAG